MAQVINGNQVKLNSGQTVQAQTGGWYDGQQFWGGSLSAPGVINSQSNQQGAGQAVSKEVVQQTNPNNWDYIQKQQQSYKPSATSQPMPGGAGTDTSGSNALGLGLGTTAPEALDLPKLYESLYASSGVRDIESELNQKTMDYNSQVAKIKDNPYLSEATMTGRIKKLDEKFSADKSSYDNQIATRKADIETQLNLQSKQFDINSQVARDALDRFNSLLSSGALDNASGEDIANLTRSTGISSQAIQSAVNANKKKNTNTQVITSTSDSGEVTAVVIDQNTGEIISQTSLGNIGNAEKGASAKEASVTSKANQLFESNKNSYGHVNPSVWNKILSAYIADGGTKKEFVDNFSTYADYNRGDFEKAYGFSL